MANGKPGDHPLTDILSWNQEVFGPEQDDLIREIVRLGGARELEREPLNLLRLDPRSGHGLDLDRVTKDLRSLRDRLRQSAVERGWEVD